MYFINKYRYQLLLLLIVFIIAAANYVPNTYLCGWDNLQTELNPLLGVRRALFSVWEEYQSFGLLAGMGHAADLPRALFLLIVSPLIPQSLIRYFYHFFMLLVGVLGTLRLFSFLFNTSSDQKKISAGTLAFIGSVFYLLNFGTVQIFSMPYEAFSTFFGFLPWLIWIFIKTGFNQTEQRHERSYHAKSISCHPEFISGSHDRSRNEFTLSLPNVFGMTNKNTDSNNSRLISTNSNQSQTNLRLFILINFLATPAYYVQTFFAVYILILGCITIGLQIKNKYNKTSLKKIVLLFGMILIVNAFWLLPQLYFIKTNGEVVKQAKINLLSTEDVFFQNFEKGTLDNFIKMQGFYYDLSGNDNLPIFDVWKNHFQKPVINLLPLLFFMIILLGLLKNNRFRYPALIALLLIAIALLPATAPFQQANQLLRLNGFINQIFRSPFTKFIIPYSLMASYLFTGGISLIADNASKLLGKFNIDFNVQRLTLNVIVLIIIFLSSLPAFQGCFFAKDMRVKIPEQYLELIDYFKNVDKNKRIALLPDYTFWGWFFHDWGYNGSGFLWYGIEQPIVSRTFDVWSSRSESYFWEVKNALESENIDKLNHVLEKYAIDYLILDYSLLPVSSSIKGMQYDRIDPMIEKSGKITLIKKWPKLVLYKINHDKKIQDFVSFSTSLPNVGPEVKVTNDDQAYNDLGDYKTVESLPYSSYYPFLDLTTQTRNPPQKWEISEDTTSFILSRQIDIDPFAYRLVADQDPVYEFLYRDDIEKYTNGIKKITFADNKIRIYIEKHTINDFSPTKVQINQCQDNKDKAKLYESDNRLIAKAADGAQNCFSYEAPYLEQRYGYLVKIANNNSEGRRLFFYVLDHTKKQSQIEDRVNQDVEYHIISPKYQYGLGYSFSFQNDSYKNLSSENRINNLTVFSFPYEKIKKMRFENSALSRSALPIDSFTAKKTNYYTYEIDLNHLRGNSSKDTPEEPVSGHLGSGKQIDLILYQEYHEGWKAYIVKRETLNVKRLLNTYFPFILGEEIREHFPINNWANGWELNVKHQTSNVERLKLNVIVIFWPQYLQYVGFGLLILCFMIALKVKR